MQSTLSPPNLSMIVPNEGPLRGGVEVTILGSNFANDMTVVFGDVPAVDTRYWSSNTLVCTLPSSVNTGNVPIKFRRNGHQVPSTGLLVFKYKAEDETSLMELALQIVGLKMTGQLEDAKQVAMRILNAQNNQDEFSPGSSD